MSPSPKTSGLHHVTAIAGDPSRNARFYTQCLGLRMVKWTVNHDDSRTFHFYFGDGEGRPGTNITFFPWTDRGLPGRSGAGQTRATAYTVTEAEVGYWSSRLERGGVAHETVDRFGTPVLTFEDPDGVVLEIAASDEAPAGRPWEGSPVPPEHQLRGFHSVTLALDDPGSTARLLEAMGLEHDGEEEGRIRYRATRGERANIVDLVETDRRRAQMGVGAVHHVAFRAEDQQEQRAWQQLLRKRGLQVTEIIDRVYFRSIYFREPGGVLFEIATESPGLTWDEPLDDLGSRLTLPPWLEKERDEIESQLPAFEPPAWR